MVKTKRIIVFTIFVFCLLSNTANSNTCVMASELYYTVETEETLQIDFAKIRETFSRGNLQLPKSFRKELFLYDTVTNVVGEYCSENGVEEVFRLDVERDMFSEATRFFYSRDESFCTTLQRKDNDFGEKHFKLEVEGEGHSLYVDVDLEKEKLFLYPPECSSLRIVDNWDGNPEVYKMIQRKKGEGVIYYPDMYVISDWNDMGQTDNHFTETYDGMYEKIRELDYLVIPEDLQGYDAVYIDIAVVLNRYMEEKHIEDVFYFDCEKDVVCQVTNMIFTCRLRGRKQTLYVDLDTFNLKAHVYEVEK